MRLFLNIYYLLPRAPSPSSPQLSVLAQHTAICEYEQRREWVKSIFHAAPCIYIALRACFLRSLQRTKVHILILKPSVIRYGTKMAGVCSMTQNTSELSCSRTKAGSQMAHRHSRSIH